MGSTLTYHCEETGKWKQNKEKQQHAISTVGAGAELARKTASKAGLPGKLKEEILYLGGLKSGKGRTKPERMARIAAMHKAFYSVRNFWYSREASYEHKREVLKSRVENAGLSGIEPYLMSAGDYAEITKTLVKFGRSAMCGKATEKEETDGKKKYKRMTNKEVLDYWGLQTIDATAQQRRLKWMQAWARDANDNRQLLAAIFGNLKFEDGPTVVDGRVQSDANPWAKRVVEDLKASRK